MHIRNAAASGKSLSWNVTQRAKVMYLTNVRCTDIDLPLRQRISVRMSSTPRMTLSQKSLREETRLSLQRLAKSASLKSHCFHRHHVLVYSNGMSTAKYPSVEYWSMNPSTPRASISNKGASPNVINSSVSLFVNSDGAVHSLHTTIELSIRVWLSTK